LGVRVGGRRVGWGRLHGGVKQYGEKKGGSNQTVGEFGGQTAWLDPQSA
jgi:hypothetical protein